MCIRDRFQTGYLTIQEYLNDLESYTLGYPNYEVKSSFTKSLSKSIANIKDDIFINNLIRSLREKDLEKFFTVLRSIFANIDYDLHIPQEKYYQTIFYLIFTLIGLKVSAEVKTNVGRIDIVIQDREIYLFEFKLNGTKEEALEQVKKNQYFQKYLSLSKEIYLIGVEFRDKNVGDYVVERHFATNS
ncbi:MAG: PD-(D/E)XK nuclease domain-containing protein, partial [Leptospiraceae bacterium]|nr:PD-(D/E)XK nuclease domain-containing protein [Leptospiraceae bacterium]